MARKMRGGSQAHLIEASDRNHYVVKFQNNPQHRRVLTNEWISATFLSYLGVSTPAVAMIRVTNEFLEAGPDVYRQLGSQRFSPPPWGGTSVRDTPAIQAEWRPTISNQMLSWGRSRTFRSSLGSPH
jgi:hypothetical protein